MSHVWRRISFWNKFVPTGAQFSDCPEVSKFAFILWSSQNFSTSSVSTCSIPFSKIRIDRFLFVVNMWTILDWVCALHSTLNSSRYLSACCFDISLLLQFDFLFICWHDLFLQSLFVAFSRNSWNVGSHCLQFFELIFQIFSINGIEYVTEKIFESQFSVIATSSGKQFLLYTPVSW